MAVIFRAMDDNTRAKYEEKAKEARASLKKWENDWADGHNGAKPGRQDIKDHPDIGEWDFSRRMHTILTHSSSTV